MFNHPSSFSVLFQPKSIFIPQESHSTEEDNQGTIKRCPMSESPARPSQVPPRPPPPRLPPQKPVALGNGGREGEMRETGLHTEWKKMRDSWEMIWNSFEEGRREAVAPEMLLPFASWFTAVLWRQGYLWPSLRFHISDCVSLLKSFRSSLPSFGELFMSISSFICSLATKEI